MRLFHLRYVYFISDTVRLLVFELRLLAFEDIIMTLPSDQSHYAVSFAPTTIDSFITNAALL